MFAEAAIDVVNGDSASDKIAVFVSKGFERAREIEFQRAIVVERNHRQLVRRITAAVMDALRKQAIPDPAHFGFTLARQHHRCDGKRGDFLEIGVALHKGVDRNAIRKGEAERS